MNFPRPCTPIKYDGTKELLMMNIQTIIIPAEFDLDDLDLDDEIGLQPNKKPISTIDKNIKRKNEHLPYKNRLGSLFTTTKEKKNCQLTTGF